MLCRPRQIFSNDVDVRKVNSALGSRAEGETYPGWFDTWALRIVFRLFAAVCCLKTQLRISKKPSWELSSCSVVFLQQPRRSGHGGCVPGPGEGLHHRVLCARKQLRGLRSGLCAGKQHQRIHWVCVLQGFAVPFPGTLWRESHF